MSTLTNHQDIFGYITSEEANYKRPIALNDSWNWGMADHIKTSFLYSNSQLLTGKSDFKPVKNITRPILNLHHRTEDIELKDVQIYVDEPSKYHLSFLVKKYHDDIFVQENDLDTYFDELNVSRIDFGGGLSKQLNKPRPEVVPLQSIVFCDQTDMLSGPIGIKHYFSPDQLLDMAKFGWGETANGATISLEALIMLSREEKKDTDQQQTAQTPGRYIEVYEIHGNLPIRFYNRYDTTDKYETRLFICAFYQKKEGQDKQGVILYTAPEKKSPFKLIKRDPVFGRALGFGGAEELFEDQVWTNYSEIRKIEMLDAASKTILKALGPNSATIAQKQKVRDMDNLEIVDVGDGGDLAQVDTFPRNMRLLDTYALEKLEHAKDMGAAQDPIQGKEPVSGTPFSSLIEQVRQGMGLHEYRRGQFAKHIKEIYRDWIIPHIQKKITQGFRFLSTLSLEELQRVRERVVDNLTETRVKEIVFDGGMVTNQDREMFKTLIAEQFKKKGNKHFIEALAGEFQNTPLAVKISVAGKSKDLAQMTEKLVNVFRTIVTNPAILQNPAMAELFNKIIEASGLDPVDFSDFEIPPEQAQPTGRRPEPTPRAPALAAA